MVRRCDGFMWYDMLPSFMKFVTGVQAIIRFCLSSFIGRNFGVTDGSIYEVRR
jgi:hypothetical protein